MVVNRKRNSGGNTDDRSKLPRDSFEKQCCGMQRGTCLPATRETIQGARIACIRGRMRNCNGATMPVPRDRRVNTEGKVAVIFSSKS